MPNNNIIARWLRNFKGDSSDTIEEEPLENNK